MTRFLLSTLLTLVIFPALAGEPEVTLDPTGIRIDVDYPYWVGDVRIKFPAGWTSNQANAWVAEHSEADLCDSTRPNQYRACMARSEARESADRARELEAADRVPGNRTNAAGMCKLGMCPEGGR